MTKTVKLLALLLFAAFCPAWLNAQAADAAEGRTSPIPITQRWVRTAGWEKTLVRGNPNLGHFTWVPMTSYPHDMGVVQGPPPPRNPQSAGYRRQQNQHFYMKPVHVPTVIHQAGSSQEPVVNQPYVPHYVKPVHAPTVVGKLSSTHTSISYRTGRQADESVYGRLKSHPYEESVSGRRLKNREDRATPGRLSLPDAEEQVYGQINHGPKVAVYPDVYGTLQSSDAYGNLASKQVYGRISSPRVRRF